MYSEPLNGLERRERIERVMHAALMVACYLIVFAGLLLSVASRAGSP